MNVHIADWGAHIPTETLQLPLQMPCSLENTTAHPIISQFAPLTYSHPCDCTPNLILKPLLSAFLRKPCVSRQAILCPPRVHIDSDLTLQQKLAISFAHNMDNSLSHLKSALWQVCHGLLQATSQWSRGYAGTLTLTGECGLPVDTACTLSACSGPAQRHLFCLTVDAAMSDQPSILVGPMGPKLEADRSVSVITY